MSLSVTRPIGRALVVASASNRGPLVATANRLGFECGQCDDPYSAMLEISRRRLAYAALILSLSGLYREELALITTVKRRIPHLEVWLAHTDGRQSTLAEAIRLGADGLIDAEGLHRMAAPSATVHTGDAQAYRPLTIPSEPSNGEPVEQVESANQSDIALGEPVLTADELRALLQDQPLMPPSGKVEE
ncbi:MAG TPA: hypothetical protein VHD56_00555 [Tepidisphaeraceae bacterium]|nr:hypothetical protein [Tepidisphaeraceae bacterium]